MNREAWISLSRSLRIRVNETSCERLPGLSSRRFVARRAVIIIHRASRYHDEMFDTRFSLGVSFDEKTRKLCKIAVPDAAHSDYEYARAARRESD